MTLTGLHLIAGEWVEGGESFAAVTMGDAAPLTVQSAGDRFTGTNAGDAGSFDVSGAVSGNTLTWQQKITTPMPMTLEGSATVDGDTLTGSVNAGAFGSMAMTGTRSDAAKA